VVSSVGRHGVSYPNDFNTATPGTFCDAIVTSHRGTAMPTTACQSKCGTTRVNPMEKCGVLVRWSPVTANAPKAVGQPPTGAGLAASSAPPGVDHAIVIGIR
jgi:hypothetical protein